MAEALNFPSTALNSGSPLLFSGQAQKEFVVNQAITTLDALLLGTVEASLQDPPGNAIDGQCFRITSGASGEWENREDNLALRIGGAWHFVQPSEGLEIFDVAAGQKVVFKTTWNSAATPTIPDNGTTIDAELRAAFSELINALRAVGVFTDS